MKTHIWKLAMVVSIWGAVANDAVGELIYVQDDPRFHSVGAGYSNLGNAESTQQRADDFMLPENAVVTNVTWWGLYYPTGLSSNVSGVEFTVRFFTDAGEKPGTLVGERKVQGSVTAEIRLADTVLYQFSGALAPSIAISNGVTYWISILDSDPGTPIGFRWSESDRPAPIAFASRAHEGGEWSTTADSWPMTYLLEGEWVLGSPPVPIANVLNDVRVPSIFDDPGRFVVIARDGVAAEVIFDASESFDPDGEALSFDWNYQHLSVPFASGVRATNVLGTAGASRHRLQLWARDRLFSANNDFEVTVVTPSVVVVWLIGVIREDAGSGAAKRSLLSALSRALASFQEGDTERAVRALHEFLRKARHQEISPIPERAEGVRQLTQILIDTVGATTANEAKHAKGRMEMAQAVLLFGQFAPPR